MRSVFAITIILSLFLNNLSAQEFSEKEVRKALKAKKIVMLEAHEQIYKVQTRKMMKWGVYQIYGVNEMEELIPCAYDSVSWFQGYEPFIILKNEGKYGIMLNPYEISDAAERVSVEYDQIKMLERNGDYYAVVKSGAHWGLIDWLEGTTVVESFYENAEDVPLGLGKWEYDLIKKAQRSLKVDLLVFDRGNGDGVFKARDVHSKKWGMYQGLDYGDEPINFDELVPAQYDSLRFFAFNGSVTAVYNDGKVGFYLSKFSYNEDAKESVPCIYDEYQRFTAEKPDAWGGTYSALYMGVKRDGKWGWVDWKSGKEKSEFKFETKEDLPPVWW